VHACLWTGTAASLVDLAPLGQDSYAFGVHGGQQVGAAFIGNGTYQSTHWRASLWRGTAASWVDLDPAGSKQSWAYAVHDGQQVGWSTLTNSFESRATIWSGTAASAVDLHAYLPAAYRSSVATGIWHQGMTTYVVGYGTGVAFGNAPQALLWVFSGFNVRLNEARLVGGNTALATVSIPTPAPAGGTTVTLKDTSPNTTIPSTVIVPAGKSLVTFSVKSNGVDTLETVQLTAKQGKMSVTGYFDLLPARLVSVTASPLAVVGGSNTVVSGLVALDGKAGPSGLSVRLSSDSLNAVVPASVNVPPGKSAAPFTVRHELVSGSTPVVFTGSTSSDTLTGQLTLLPARPGSLSVSPASVMAGGTSTGTVTLGAKAGDGGFVVSLTSSSLNAIVPASVVVPKGATSATFTILTLGSTAANEVATIAMTFNGQVKSANLAIKALVVTAMSAPATINENTSALVTITLNGPAPAGGLTVGLSTVGPVKFTEAGTFAAGETTKTFRILASLVRGNRTATLTANLHGVSKRTTITVIGH